MASRTHTFQVSSGLLNVPFEGFLFGKARVFDLLEKTTPGAGGEIQLTDGILALLKKEKVYGYNFKGKRFDAGDKFGMLQATVEFALKRPEFADKFRAFLKGLEL